MMIKLTQTEQQAKHEGRISGGRVAYVNPEHIASMYPTGDGTLLHIAGQMTVLRVEETPQQLLRLLEATEPPVKDDLCVDCGARFWRNEACVCSPDEPAPAVLVPLPADATPEGQGRLRIEFEVYRDDGGPLPKAREIGNGITEGLPSEWYEDSDGDEFYLGDSSWEATWLGQRS